MTLIHKMHVKSGDTVEVISGKDKGKTGKVLKAIPKKGTVVVENINIAKKHTKPSQKSPQGGIVEKALPLYASKVLLYCPNCQKGVRTGKKVLDNGKKVRVCKKCGETLDK